MIAFPSLIMKRWEHVPLCRKEVVECEKGPKEGLSVKPSLSCSLVSSVIPSPRSLTCSDSLDANKPTAPGATSEGSNSRFCWDKGSLMPSRREVGQRDLEREEGRDFRWKARLEPSLRGPWPSSVSREPCNRSQQMERKLQLSTEQVSTHLQFT